jgi:hypothetical protein
MRTYRVTIRATVTKTLTVKAENEDDAYVAAHEDFSVLCDGEDERYDEETLEVKEVKP